MPKKLHAAADGLIKKLRKDLDHLIEEASNGELSSRDRQSIAIEIEKAAATLTELAAELDLFERPASIFDPGNPRTIAFFIALALTSQDREKLSGVRDVHGAGVYAIYYKGDFPLYAKISCTETPIYIGQAAPMSERARTPNEQGPRLSGRLNEHKRSIEKASATLKISDFEYRALVVQSGWETGAENYLIKLFKPIWNKETRLVYGIGKHGDSSQTRRNKISPWDTLHKGRAWTGEDELEAKKSVEKIKAELEDHFEKTKIYQDLSDILSSFVSELKQL